MVVKAREPVIKLSESDKKMLKDLEASIEISLKGLNALKEMGINVTDLENKLAFSVKARDTLLKEFS